MNQAWSTNTEPNSFAGLPSGLAGKLGGWLMARTNRDQQLQVLRLALVSRGERVLEIGHGPGVLIQALVAETQASLIVGVDPSAEMREMAARRNAAAIAAGRVQLSAGTAEETGQPDAAFDVVLSVNTVAIWPDLAAGARELARVLRPGGRLLLSWHGGTNPGRMTRRLCLNEDQLARIEAVLRAEVGPVERLRTARCEVFSTVRPAEPPAEGH